MGLPHDTIHSPHARRRTRLVRACLFGVGALGLIALGTVVGATWAIRRTEGVRTQAAPMTTAPVSAITGGPIVTVPGSVIANAYREVKVTPIAPGIVTKVHADLGTVVKRGAPLLTLFSAELADSQTKYLSMSAMLEEDHKKLERTRKLVDIGAASRQDLEEITAVHEAHETEVAAARQRLQLLGLSAEQVRALQSSSQVVST